MTLAERLRAHAENSPHRPEWSLAQDLRQAAAELEAQRWIPVTERMPPDFEGVEVWLVEKTGLESEGYHQRLRIAYLVSKDNAWFGERGAWFTKHITHWRRVKGPA